LVQAIIGARARAITGKVITLFRLERVNELTGGDSLAANIRLVLNNAGLAGRTAAELTAPGR